MKDTENDLLRRSVEKYLLNWWIICISWITGAVALYTNCNSNPLFKAGCSSQHIMFLGSQILPSGNGVPLPLQEHEELIIAFLCIISFQPGEYIPAGV